MIFTLLIFITTASPVYILGGYHGGTFNLSPGGVEAQKIFEEISRKVILLARNNLIQAFTEEVPDVEWIDNCGYLHGANIKNVEWIDNCGYLHGLIDAINLCEFHKKMMGNPLLETMLYSLMKSKANNLRKLQLEAIKELPQNFQEQVSDLKLLKDLQQKRLKVFERCHAELMAKAKKKHGERLLNADIKDKKMGVESADCMYHTRDNYMANKIMSHRNPEVPSVVIVGAGHLPGLTTTLQKLGLKVIPIDLRKPQSIEALKNAFNRIQLSND